MGILFFFGSPLVINGTSEKHPLHIPGGFFGTPGGIDPGQRQGWSHPQSRKALAKQLTWQSGDPAAVARRERCDGWLVHQ